MATKENGRLCYGSLSSLKQEAQVGEEEIKERSPCFCQQEEEMRAFKMWTNHWGKSVADHIQIQPKRFLFICTSDWLIYEKEQARKNL